MCFTVVLGETKGRGIDLHSSPFITKHISVDERIGLAPKMWLLDCYFCTDALIHGNNSSSELTPPASFYRPKAEKSAAILQERVR